MNTITNRCVAKLTHRHRAIMEYMIANPEVPMADIAKLFNVTLPWLSSLVHSELFQMELSYLQDVAFSDVVVSIKDRLNNLAHTSLKRLQERLEVGAVTNDTLVDVSELALKSLGFGPKPQGLPQPNAPVFNQQINHFGSAPIDAKLLADARDQMLKRQVTTLTVVPQEETKDVPGDRHTNYYLDPPTGESQAPADQGRAGAGLPGAVEASVAPVGN